MRRNQNLSEKVTVKFTVEEKSAIDKKAKEAGMNRSEYLRHLTLCNEEKASFWQSNRLRNDLLFIGNEIGHLKAKHKTGKPFRAEDYENVERRIYDLCRM